MIVCPTCRGTKVIPRFPPYAIPTFARGNNEKPCDKCQGTGQVPEDAQSGSVASRILESEFDSPSLPESPTD